MNRRYLIIEVSTNSNGFTFGEILDVPYYNFEDAEIAANDIIEKHPGTWVTIIPIYTKEI